MLLTCGVTDRSWLCRDWSAYVHRYGAVIHGVPDVCPVWFSLETVGAVVRQATDEIISNTAEILVSSLVSLTGVVSLFHMAFRAAYTLYCFFRR